MKRTFTSLHVLLILIFVLLLSISCRSGNNTSEALQATEESLQSTQIALSVQQTVQAMREESNEVEQTEATEEPSWPAPVPVLETSDNSALFNGITIEFSENLFQKVQAEITSMGYDQFQFSGYAFSDNKYDPSITVYATQTMTEVDSSAEQIISNLQSVLSTQPDNLDKMPFYPFWHAAQFTVMQVDYLTFENGQGVRYLTQYGQNYWPINNQSMFYTFQGITNDGAYYVSAILPVSHPSLPKNGDVYTGDYNALQNDFDGYLSEIADQINGQAGDSFFPHLDDLDDMMESLMIHK